MTTDFFKFYTNCDVEGFRARYVSCLDVNCLFVGEGVKGREGEGVNERSGEVEK